MDEELVKEFFIEALELLDEAEAALLAIEQKQDPLEQYNKIFRAFHSVKGGAGMFELMDLNKYMHYVEDQFSTFKESLQFTEIDLEYFLKAIDGAKRVMENQPSEFDLITPSEFGKRKSGHSVEEAVHVIEEHQQHVKVEAHTTPLVYNFDDDPDINMIVGELIESVDLRSKAFENSKDFFKNFEADQPSAVVLDLTLKDENGLDVLKKIKDISSSTPVIVLTGSLNVEVSKELTNNGAFAIFEKPLSSSYAFLSSVRSAVILHDSMKTLSKSVTLLKYQFSDLKEFLKGTGKEQVMDVIDAEMKTIIAQKRRLEVAQSKRLDADEIELLESEKSSA